MNSQMYLKILLLIAGVHVSCTVLPKRQLYRIQNGPKVAGWPAVFVPGDGGAQLEANLTGKPEVVHYVCDKKTSDYYTLWLDLELFLPLAFDCWIDNMKLVYNATSGKTANQPGVDIRIPGGFGNTSAIEWLDPSKRSVGEYFVAVVQNMVHWGYKRSKNIRGAPLDWRKAPNEFGDYYKNLKSLIEETYTYNGNKRVVVIAHSMGNPSMLYFYNSVVDQAWKDKYIRSHVGISGAWGGAVKIIKLFASGYNMGHYRIVLPPSKLRPMLRTFPSSSFLMPSYNLWTNQEILATTAKRNYTLADLEQFFTDIGYPDGWSMYQNTGYLLGNLTAPGVEVHCIYGLGLDTPARFDWASGYFPDYQPSTKFGDGDGTVNRRSLETCLGWKNKNKGKPVSHYVIPKGDHLDILQNSQVISIVKQALYQDYA